MKTDTFINIAILCTLIFGWLLFTIACVVTVIPFFILCFIEDENGEMLWFSVVGVLFERLIRQIEKL